MKLLAASCAALLVICLDLGDGKHFAHAASPASEVKVVRAGEVELHYVEQGNGIPVIFVHGSVDDYRTFQPQLEPLSQHYRVISYSRRYNFPNARTTFTDSHSALVEAARSGKPPDSSLAHILRTLWVTPTAPTPR